MRSAADAVVNGDGKPVYQGPQAVIAGQSGSIHESQGSDGHARLCLERAGAAQLADCLLCVRYWHPLQVSKSLCGLKIITTT